MGQPEEQRKCSEDSKMERKNDDRICYLGVAQTTTTNNNEQQTATRKKKVVGNRKRGILHWISTAEVLQCVGRKIFNLTDCFFLRCSTADSIGVAWGTPVGK